MANILTLFTNSDLYTNNRVVNDLIDERNTQVDTLINRLSHGIHKYKNALKDLRRP